MKTVEERIRAFNAGRLQPALGMKYKAMASSPFSFYRATCHLFYEDLHAHKAMESGPLVWCCGDLHMENFGSYRAYNGLAYFDINDFDECALAPASWDLVRFLCSIGMAADPWDYTSAEAEDLMYLFLHAYQAQLKLAKAYAIQSETSPPLIQEFFEMARQEKESELIKTRVNKKEERLKPIEGKTLDIDKEVRKDILKVTNAFMRKVYPSLTVTDALFRIAGTGSLGVRRYVLLAHDEEKDKYRLLDIKEALPSSLGPYLKMNQPAWPNEGERVTWVQGRMQYAPPRFTGIITMAHRHFVLKQLQPSAQKIDYRLCNKKMKNVETVIDTMALALASAQIRSAGQNGSEGIDSLLNFSNGAAWQKPLVMLARSYVPQVVEYFRKFAAFR